MVLAKIVDYRCGPYGAFSGTYADVCAFLSIFRAGFGLPSVVATVLLSQSLTLPQVFLIVATMCALIGLFNLLIERSVSRQSLDYDTAQRSKLSRRMIVQILRSPAVVPVTMAFLGVCYFIGMINFQFLPKSLI